MKWRPIETAPKDDEMLLLYRREDGVRAGYWDEEIGWYAVETLSLTGGRVWPKHWMPLPSPPTTETP